MMRSVRAVVVGAVACAVVCGLVGGCGVGEPAPEPSVVVPVSPPVGAELVCGVDVASVEAISGYPVDRVVDNLSVQDGVGSGECEVWTESRDGVLFAVDMWPASSEKAQQVRAEVDGRGGRDPMYTYDPGVADGAMWGADDVPFDRVSGSVFSEIFVDDTLVRVYFSAVAPLRTPSQDFLSVTDQVALFYGLSERAGTS